MLLSDPIIFGAKATRTHELQGCWVLALRSRLAVSCSELGGETFRRTCVSSSPTQPSTSFAPVEIEGNHMIGSIFVVCHFKELRLDFVLLLPSIFFIKITRPSFKDFTF